MDPSTEPSQCDSLADPSLPTYKQVITDHPSAKKAVKSAKLKKPRAAPKSKSKSKKKNKNISPSPDIASGDDEDNAVKKVIVTTNFKLFVLDVDRSKKAKKVWLLISPPNPIEIEITISPKDEATTHDQFISLVTSKCENAVANTGAILSDGLSSGSPVINWFVSIARVEGFKKGKPFLLENQMAFNTWMEALADNEADESTLSIEMTNPNRVAKLQHDAEVLAKDAVRKEAKRLITVAREAKRARAGDSEGGKRKRLDEDSDEDTEGSDDEVEYDKDAVKLFMRQLYATHSANALYDRHLPVYINPLNHSQYFLLSNGTCQKWARALVKVREGVSIQSPPKEFKYETLPPANSIPTSTKQLARTSTPAGCAHHACSGHASHASPPSSSDGPQPGKDVGIRDYINFIGLRQADEVVDLLIRNDLQNFKIFRSRNLDRSALRSLGLTLGVVTQLCDYVSKFERHLAKQDLLASN
ncbi:hypothetical protein PGTUg99_032105 [Puccinia graminis f. sp. tritici]|uniref:Uncharacterized protein n=1 Tax=Puccinia graminis f. sp. tritici TaxID=56615 RepID=A0A5B0QRU6_PUCGR|nr:hypothetical protein PGTUg99_032105 [Puccinia graminis f. sp. tritici]